MKIKILVALTVIVAILVGAFLYKSYNNSINQISCTTEAKICPDGTAVGRSGPQCEFAKCPTPIMKPDKISCNGIPTPESTEGPYFLEGSPLKNNLIEDNSRGIAFVVKGKVLNTECKAIENAKVDIWQTDENGNYDLEGYSYRGHTITDENGNYAFQTIVPNKYPGRIPHIHVKVTTSERTLTTQLYIPGEKNEDDELFDELLLMNIQAGQQGLIGTFDFVL